MSGSLGYFTAIETLFIELRGSPLLLSPADWKVAEAWRQEGIPLAVVEAALRELFAARAEEAKKVPGLRYCSRAVRRRWEQQRALTAGSARSEPLEIDLPGRLTALAARLPGELPERLRLAESIQHLAVLEDPAAVEERLAALDRELLEAVDAALAPAQRAALEAGVDSALEPHAGKLAAEEWAALREERWRQLLRRRHGVPRLSLFGD